MEGIRQLNMVASEQILEEGEEASHGEWCTHVKVQRQECLENFRNSQGLCAGWGARQGELWRGLSRGVTRSDLCSKDQGWRQGSQLAGRCCNPGETVGRK